MLILASILLIVLSIKATAKPTSCDAKCTSSGMFASMNSFSTLSLLVHKCFFCIGQPCKIVPPPNATWPVEGAAPGTTWLCYEGGATVIKAAYKTGPLVKEGSSLECGYCRSSYTVGNGKTLRYALYMQNDPVYTSMKWYGQDPVQLEYKLCNFRYALCTTAPCKSVGPELQCNCTVYSKGFSVALAQDCSKFEPYTSGKKKYVTSLYSAINERAITEQFCNTSYPWGDCLDQPCEVDPIDPTKAVCKCSPVSSNPWITFAFTSALPTPTTTDQCGHDSGALETAYVTINEFYNAFAAANQISRHHR